MSNTFHELSIKDLRKIFPDTMAKDLSDDFFISDIHYKEDLEIMKSPCRFNGYLAVFCIKGDLEVEINLKSYRIRENSVIINVPGNICRVHRSDGDSPVGDLHFVVLAVSGDFLSSFKMDYVRLFNESLAMLDNPCFTLDDDEMQMFGRYFGLIKEMIARNPEDLVFILRNLVASALYYAGSLWKTRLENVPEEQRERSGRENSTRGKLVLEDFLKLVAEYHDRERGMAFYADKLCLTPKYLSKLIKTESGKSGPEWIDSFVILEAKNMLRYSEMPIKEIVYRLNFPNSSVFYKFFKAHTGQTPSEYRR